VCQCFVLCLVINILSVVFVVSCESLSTAATSAGQQSMTNSSATSSAHHLRGVTSVVVCSSSWGMQYLGSCGRRAGCRTVTTLCLGRLIIRHGVVRNAVLTNVVCISLLCIIIADLC